ncbi:MAG: GGDEF domain-containing phosphodiesterase, partial [Campylobacterota bacterium]|nr:GGDEF domain-containing phosphodiesterase [Campylobacterota bacterium]
QAQNRKFALMALSLDNFNVLRATLGYQKTDIFINRFSEYLQHIAKRLGYSLYQMTRHNFMIMAPDTESGDQAIKIVRQIDKDLNDLLDFSNAQMHLTFSTGVSFFPESGNSINFLIDNAYKALSEAQNKGDGYVVVDQDMPFLKHAQYELSLHNEMHEALKNHEFVLHYQPIIDLQTDNIIGAEALIRWQHPERGMIAPMEFIPISEKTGFTVELGRFVINEVCKQQKRWEIFKFDVIQVSVNLSFREIETTDIAAYIADTVQKNQVDPALLKFEITENVAMINAETTKSEFESLKQLGVQLALDDFGTGYSSFAYLKEFSLDTLKIDRIFIYDLVRNDEHQTIVKAMIALGHSFGLNVTAEGIEDKATYELLKEYGCDFGQGYYMSKPLPVFEFQELIRSDVYKIETDKER